MSEQDKQAQNQTTDDQKNNASQTGTSEGSKNQPAQASEQKEASRGSDAEQTGEGTGAKAGEYS